MAVYTKLTFEEISTHLQKNYKLNKLTSFIEIIEGIDNSNFILNFEQQRFILTIFENRIKKDDLPFFVNLKLHLANKNIPCPKPIATCFSCQIITEIKSKSSIIVSFLQGAILKPRADGIYSNITSHHCFEVGKILAKMHLASTDFKESRINDLGILGWEKLFNQFSHLIKGYEIGLATKITEILNFLNINWQHDLPSGVTHLDLFPDNVFFDSQNKVSAVIDFYFAATDSFIYDFAVTVNAWCFDENNHFDTQKFADLMRGYNIFRNFSTLELNFLKIALTGAALRFFLTRLNDWFFTPKDSLVKVKNPREYLEKLEFFKSQL
jgi:homoserine kinase type II